MRNRTLLVVLPLLWASLAMAQYKHTFQWSNTDITLYATQGNVNAWSAMNGSCAPGSLAYGQDLPYCIGAGNLYIYQFNLSTRKWVIQPVGPLSAGSKIVGGSVNNLFIAEPQCTFAGGVQGYKLWLWNGSSLSQPNSTACTLEYSLGLEDGVIAAVGGDHWLYYSTDGGKTYSTWISGYKYVSMMNEALGCAIDINNMIWQVTHDDSPVQQKLIPSGTPIQCWIADDAFMVLNSAGTVYLLNTSTFQWDKVAGPVIGVIAGASKAHILGLDYSGNVYHWNVFAPTITGTTSGTYANWNGMNPGRQPTPQHTVSISVCFPHGINCHLASQGPTDYRTNFNVSMSDTSPLCDPVYGGDQNYPECGTTTSGTDSCSQGGLIDTPPQVSYVNKIGEDNIQWAGSAGNTGPTLSGSVTGPGGWNGTVWSKEVDACYLTGGTPTCPVGDTSSSGYEVEETYGCAFPFKDLTGNASAICNRNVAARMVRAVLGQTSPWKIFTPYTAGSDGTITCEPTLFLKTHPYYGHYEYMPYCR
jgi:hypothetical protein